MIFQKFSDPDPILLDRGLKIKDMPIKTLNGVFVLEQTEVEMLKNTVFLVWHYILKLAEINSFIGLVRFDLIPEFKKVDDSDKFDLGRLSIKGIYEVNAHSPECAAVVSALHRVAPDLAKKQPNAVQRLAQAISEEFGSREIIFVPGDGLIKNCWGKIFFEDLRRTGLNIVWEEPDEIMKKNQKKSLDPKIIWRWGDTREKGYSEYSPEFRKFLLSQEVVFNTVKMENDLSNKGLLIPNGNAKWDSLVGNNKILSLDSLRWGIENKDWLVLKPLGGSSGMNIVFGRLSSRRNWKKNLQAALHSKQPFGLFEARWLPRVFIEGSYYAVDINVACWVSNDKIRYLYSIIRIDDWERYWNKGVINVAQGAAFAGAVVDEI